MMILGGTGMKIDKHIKIVIIIGVTAIICAWIMRPQNRFSLEMVSGSFVFLLDSSSGRTWQRSGGEFVEMKKRSSENKATKK